MSYRLPRGALMPFTTGLAAVLTALGVIGFAPAIATAAPAGHGINARDQEWWLASLHVPQAWQKAQGSGITVAVLGTGVDARYPGLAGSVVTGPDYTGSDRTAGSSYWGGQGTAVAGIIASHQPGSGLVGVAPAAKILSVRVTLEFNDPLAADQTLARRLPQAIADGIRYAADHGARIIDLPLDPGTLGLTTKGDPAAAGGSPAEQAAVSYALSKGVVLVAPAGDDGQGPGLVNYPAAYSGVIAVGAIDKTGHLASFSTRRSYPSLTAPGVGLIAAAPLDGYGTISSTSTASGIVAGVAALVLSRYPALTVAQVTQALVESTVAATPAASLPPLPARSAAGTGFGTVDAVRAVDMAAVITAASQPHRQPTPTATPHKPAPHKPARHTVTAAPHRPASSTLARSVLRDAVAAVVGLIVLLVIALLVVRSRRERDRGGPGDRTRTRGQHENRKPDRGPAPAAGPDVAGGAGFGASVGLGTSAGLGLGTSGGLGTSAGFGASGGFGTPAQAGRTRPDAAGWGSPAGWQGGGLGELGDASSRPVVAPAPRSGYRSGRGASRADADSGPPWAPATPPKRLVGPLPVASSSLPPPQPGRGIRVPGDMAAGAEPEPPVSFDLTTPPADFDLSTPAFGLTPPTFDTPPPAFDPAPFDRGPAASGPEPSEADSAPTRNQALPTRQSLGFAAAPVAADYAAPPERAAAADPSYIWDLAATDVFPAATDAAVPPDEEPGA